MTPTECVDLVEFIAGRCPAMRMQDNTPDTWYVDLVGYDLADALEAARTVTLRQTFIGIGDLVTECQSIVNRREGQRRIAEREAEIEAENPGELSNRERPLAALLAGTPIKSVPRRSWTERRAITAAARPPFTDAELAAAKAELDSVRPGVTG